MNYYIPLTPAQAGAHAQDNAHSISKIFTPKHRVDPGLRRDERMWVRGLGIVFLACMVLLMSACKKAPDTTSEPAVATATQTIYLVRHAEKQKGDNPSLTKAGHERAELIKDMLGDKGVTYVHSTNLNRTLETATPLADSLGMDIQIYDGKDLEGFAKTLRAAPGVHLVVGHSNTTPDLVAHLNGEAINLMPETEYDRFTTVKLGKDGKAVTDITRFGK